MFKKVKLGAFALIGCLLALTCAFGVYAPKAFADAPQAENTLEWNENTKMLFINGGSYTIDTLRQGMTDLGCLDKVHVIAFDADNQGNGATITCDSSDGKGMFEGCTELEAVVNVAQMLDDSILSSATPTFLAGETNDVGFNRACYGLTNLKIFDPYRAPRMSSQDTVTTAVSMFEGCSSLTNATIGSWPSFEGITQTDMFKNCLHLGQINALQRIQSESGISGTWSLMFWNNEFCGNQTVPLFADVVPSPDHSLEDSFAMCPDSFNRLSEGTTEENSPLFTQFFYSPNNTFSNGLPYSFSASFTPLAKSQGPQDTLNVSAGTTFKAYSPFSLGNIEGFDATPYYFDPEHEGVAFDTYIAQIEVPITLVDRGQTTKQTRLVGDRFNLPTPTQAGWKFGGWEDADGNKSGKLVPNKPTTYYAVWTEDVDPTPQNNFTITFDAGDGSFTDGSTLTFEFSKSLTSATIVAGNVPAPTLDGMTFVSWQDADGKAIEFPLNFSGESKVDTTFTASWKGDTVTNTFNANGHGTFSGAATLSMASTYGSTLTLPADTALTPERGYIFVGWYTQATGGTQVDAKTDCPRTATVYYAHYKEAAQVSLTFDAGEGSVDGKSELVLSNLLEGDKVENVSNAVLEGYNFIGWKNATTGETITFPLTVPGENTTYVAEYEEIPTPTPDPEPTPSDTGWEEDEDGWKYILPDGSEAEGWQWIEQDDGGYWYYFGEGNYAITSGWTWVVDHWYYFYENGEMATNTWLWDGAWYWVCSTGPMIQGLWQWIDGAWYGFNWNGTMCQGWVWDNGYNAWFYCFDNGVVARNMWFDGYYFLDSGVCLI